MILISLISYTLRLIKILLEYTYGEKYQIKAASSSGYGQPRIMRTRFCFLNWQTSTVDANVHWYGDFNIIRKNSEKINNILYPNGVICLIQSLT
jgi:hypothetical protein